ncbi:Protein of unknown function [Clostridium collagenovorans DSM 3089]|uniref:DUF2809 domain-containing protein n=1 Tax=Clostridium collagenovorans DSM 3089 TaxID=1121306 RepID=A0A1M5UZF9_9CLOT|nr:DUF2809 domain-containing protein [Clostridium collagenovorans]SHH68248.1 Protein of unknown function [Clostridium collagenovorans DSM 3089]
MKRSRMTYLILSILVMILGLLSRRIDNLPQIISAYSGDILWSLMIFLLIAFIFNKGSSIFIISMAIIFSYSVEISQLYHAPWIDGIRGTTLGALVLGYGFLWSDLVCYTIGVMIGAGLDLLIMRYIRKRDRI